jgi:1-aminocyclopropane-1-carboxylate deaminase/D-cysteine desulfhydrase-like pyridoxal-dependent ACC family enzyme
MLDFIGKLIIKLIWYKAMACLIDHIKEGRFDSNDIIIFLHTGGTPALFAYHEDLYDINHLVGAVS